MNDAILDTRKRLRRSKVVKDGMRFFGMPFKERRAVLDRVIVFMFRP